MVGGNPHAVLPKWFTIAVRVTTSRRLDAATDSASEAVKERVIRLSPLAATLAHTEVRSLRSTSSGCGVTSESGIWVLLPQLVSSQGKAGAEGNAAEDGEGPQHR